MNRISFLVIGAFILAGLGLAGHARLYTVSVSDTEAGFDAPEEMPEEQVLSIEERMRRELADWKRPEGPPRVALQAGHWKAAEAPDELENLRANGTSGGGKREWEVNLEIARKAKPLLEARGIVVEILPTTIPPDHYADAFVAIHADGNPDTTVSGYKAAAPRRDLTGSASSLAMLLDLKYEEATGLPYDPNVTRNMRGYYAFNWRRYEHSLHPMTPAAILETGFLTNPRDRRIIVSDQAKAARGLADAVLAFLEERGLLAPAS